MAFLTNTFQIEADIKQKKHIGKPVITANDTSTFIVSVQDNGVPMNMSKVTKAVLVNLCPDRQVFETVGVIQGDDKVVFDLPAEATAVAGTVRATVQLHGNDERVSTISFNYEVAKDLRMLHNPTAREKMLIEVALQDGPLYIEQAKVAAEKAEKVAAENKTRWLPAVETVALRNSSYPNPAHGDTVRVTSEGRIYRSETGRGWILTDQYNPAAIDQVTAQLAEKANKGELIPVSQIDKNQGKFDQTFMSDELLQQIAGTAPINSVPADKSITEIKLDVNYNKSLVKNTNGQINGAYTPKVTFQHPRGDNEMVGTTTYAQPIIGFYEQLSNDLVFNRLELPVYTVSNENFEYKIFIRDAKAAFIPANETAVASGSLTAEQTNRNTTKTQMLYFDTPIFVPKGKHLYILVKLPTQKVYLKIFSDNGGVVPLRHGFPFNTLGDWATQFAYASDTGTRFQTSFKAYFEIKTEMLADKIVTSEKLSQDVLELINTPPEQVIANIRVNMPNEINVVVGDTIEIFYNAIVGVVDIFKYNINFRTTGVNSEVINKGNRYKSRWIYTPQSGDVNFKVICDVYDMQNNLIGTGTSTIKVNAVKSSPSVAKNVLCIGDSLTRGGEWVTELRRRLVGTGGTPAGLGLTNLNFIGTAGDSPNRYEGYGGWTFGKYVSAPTSPSTSNVWINVTSGMKTAAASEQSIWSDGTNQWQLETIDSVDGRLKFKHYPDGGSYLMPTSGNLTFVSGGGDTANIVYSGTTIEGGNPFWNSALGRNDFVSYCSKNGFSGIDYVFILLGWNELGNKAFTADDHATTEANAKLLIDRIHADYPNAKIVLMGLQLPSWDGLGANYGAEGDYWNYFFAMQSIFGLNDTYQRLAQNAAYSSFVSFVNVASQYDNVNNISTSTRQVNTRNSTTEKYGSNGVHPNINGYYQIADIAYRKIMSMI